MKGLLKCINTLIFTGKGPSIWDELTHTSPELIFNRDNGDIACNSYELYREDVQLLKAANVRSFQTSKSRYF